MQLDRLQQRFERTLDRAEAQLAAFLVTAHAPGLQSEQIHQLEGWLSDVWQAWCRFCRTTVIVSCTGCSTAAAGVIAGVHASPEVVSFIASRQKKGKPPATAGVNSVLRMEPTWGHIDILLEVIQALSPGNATSLLGGFGTVPQIDEVRLIRNAAAHRNLQTHQEVLALSPAYKTTGIRHPVEALLWGDPPTGRTLIQARIDDMRVASRNVCA